MGGAGWDRGADCERGTGWVRGAGCMEVAGCVGGVGCGLGRVEAAA
jgi:hypothetical protein